MGFTTTMKYDIGFTCSAFDLFHAGHMAMLQEAKGICNYLIVGLQTDPTIDKDIKGELKHKSDRSHKRKPIYTLPERYLLLRGCKYIDEIIPYDTEVDLDNMLRVLPIDVRIIGADYEGKDFTGKQYIGKYYDIYYNERNHDFSTSSLRDKLRGELCNEK